MTASPSGEAPREIWRKLAEKALGASLSSAATRTLDDLAIQPLYDRESRDRPRPWRATADWSVSQRVDHPVALEANKSALLDLEGGADALTLVFDTSPYARGFGLPHDAASLDTALATIELDFIGLRLDAGPGTAIAAGHLTSIIEARRLTSAGLRIDLGFDPIGVRARDASSEPGALALILDLAAKAGLRGCPMLADGRPYHEAGASEAQELAAILATGVAYLRMLESHGLPLDMARRAIAVLLVVDADVVLGLAKTRALRRLWASVEVASGLAPEPLRLHAETSWRMMARREPWVNVMRATAATVAAGLGGADSITVLPFTLPLGLPDDAARRLARNVQRVLLDEANLGRVEDPAAGAGGFEALTNSLCERAWLLFQDIERQGGMEAAIDAGSFTAAIAETARTRAARFATFEAGLVGTTRFPSLEAASIAVLDIAPRVASNQVGALPCLRDAMPFEALREASEAMPAAPTVFLATLGQPAAFGARAIYAMNFFATAGIAAHPIADQRDIATLNADFEASGTAVACLCGTDAAYAEMASMLVVALRERGARRVFVAGTNPGTDRPDFAALANAFIHDGCAALDILRDCLSLYV